MKRKKERTQLPIGEVARSFGVSDNTIRRMEAAGLMTPARVNELTGYRYYDVDNIITIGSIMNIKTFGFTYEEIREGLNDADGLQILYDKLIAKRAAMDLMISKLGRRLPEAGTFRVSLTHTPELYSFVMTEKIAPTVRAARRLLRSAVFEAVNRECPIDYSLPLVLTCEETDLRKALSKKSIEITACVPLRGKYDDPDVVLMPGIKAASFIFDKEAGTTEEIVDKIEAEMKDCGYKQNGRIEAIIDASENKDGRGSAANGRMHILIPVE